MIRPAIRMEAVHGMIPRYSRPQMARIWEPENYFRIQLEIEALCLRGAGGARRHP